MKRRLWKNWPKDLHLTLLDLLPTGRYMSAFFGWREPPATMEVLGVDWPLVFVATTQRGYCASYCYERHEFALAS